MSIPGSEWGVEPPHPRALATGKTPPNVTGSQQTHCWMLLAKPSLGRERNEWWRKTLRISIHSDKWQI